MDPGSASPLGSTTLGARPLRASILASLTAKATEMVTLALLATVVPRALGPSDYGVFATVLTVATLGSLALTLGGPALMTRYVPTVPAGPRRLAVARALGLRFGRSRMRLVALVDLIAIAAVLGAPAVFPAVPTVAAAAGLTVNVAATVLLLIPLGLGRTGWWVARFPVQNALLVLACLVLHARFGVDGAVVSVPFVGGLVLLLVTALVWSDVSPRGGADVADPPDSAAHFGMLQGVAALLTQLVHRGGVVAVVVLGGTSAEAGHAALAVGITLGATYAVLQVFTVSMPHLSGSLHSEPGQALRPELAEATLRRLAGWFLVVLVPACAAAGIVVADVVPAVLGDGYEGAVDAFAPALGVVVLAPLGSLLVSSSALRLEPRAAALAAVTAAFAFSAAALVAVPLWGATGATASSLIGVLVGTVTSMRLLPGAAGTLLATLSLAGCAVVLAAAGVG